jgi:hypothetical protein
MIEVSINEVLGPKPTEKNLLLALEQQQHVRKIKEYVEGRRKTEGRDPN